MELVKYVKRKDGLGYSTGLVCFVLKEKYMEMIECYDCKGKVPEIVLVDIDGKPICPECEKIKGVIK